MISGMIFTKRFKANPGLGVILISVILCLSAPVMAQANLPPLSTPEVAAQHQELYRLLAPLAQLKDKNIAFTEQRHSLFFKQPKKTSGYIRLTHNNTLIRHLDSPRQHYRINAHQMVIEYDKDPQSKTTYEKKVLNTEDYPQIQQLYTLFTALFNAQVEILLQFYQYQIRPIDATVPQTQLDLTARPHDPFIDHGGHTASLVPYSIYILFQQQQIRQIRFDGLDHERLEITFKLVNLSPASKPNPDSALP